MRSLYDIIPVPLMFVYNDIIVIKLLGEDIMDVYSNNYYEVPIYYLA